MKDFYLQPETSPRDVLIEVYNFCMTLAREKRWQITIKPWKNTRTLRQNKYLWACVYPTIRRHYEKFEQVSYIEEVWHELFKKKYLELEVHELRNEQIKLYRSTTKLSKQEFSDYLEQIFAEVAPDGCVVPEPDWQWKIKKEESK